LPWPLYLTLALGLVPIPPLVLKKPGIAVIASLPFALLPWWQLYQLYLKAGL
jgi:hypothetical protein